MAIVNLRTGYNCDAFHDMATIRTFFDGTLAKGTKVKAGLITLEHNGYEDEEQWTVRIKTTKKDLRGLIARINEDQGVPVNDMDLDDQLEMVWAGDDE